MSVREIIQKHIATGVLKGTMHDFMLRYLKIVGCNVVYPFQCDCGRTLKSKEEALCHVKALA